MIAIATTGCAADTQDDSEDVEQLGDVGQQLLAGPRLTPHEVAALVRRAGFPEYEVGKMVCTARYESSFYERASNRNSNGTIDRGVFQINSIWIGASGCPHTATGLYDADANARCAHAVWREQGNNAWYGYQAHRSTCDHYPAP
jgi:hypothetical protein